MSKTHWKKLHNPDYLGAYALEPGEDMILTIDYVAQEEITGNGGKKETGMVCHFAEKGCKPMILNATNSKTIEKIHGTPYIEEWHGKQIQIYIASVAAFGDTVEALRVRPFVPQQAVTYTCSDCGREIAGYGGHKAATVAQRTKETYGRPLCSDCAVRAKEEANGAKP